MAVTIAAVLTGFRAKWNATSAITTAIPGGLIEGNAVETTEPPYAIVSCVFKEQVNFSGASIETYTLTVKVYAGTSAVTAGTTLATVLDTFDHKAGGALTITPSSGTAYHMDSDPVQQSLEKDPARLDAEKVLIAARAWDIILDVRG